MPAPQCGAAHAATRHFCHGAAGFAHLYVSPTDMLVGGHEHVFSRRVDRFTIGHHGLKYFAILLLLARLELRASEVVALTLDDIDWDAGEITVQGNGSMLTESEVRQDADGPSAP